MPHICHVLFMYKFVVTRRGLCALVTGGLGYGAHDLGEKNSTMRGEYGDIIDEKTSK